jgi:hypothetical protein
MQMSNKTLWGMMIVALAAFLPCHLVAESIPDRTILFIIDGLSVDAPRRIEMPVLNQLIQKGAYYKAMHLLPPGHPEKGPTYPWSCSMPNPMLMSGTPFIGVDGVRTSMVQHAFGPDESAFIVNAKAYKDVSDGFGTYISKPSQPDSLVIDLSKDVITTTNPRFMRIHLQRAGIEGLKVSKKWTKDEPFHRDIWHEKSIYREAIKEADKQLGVFIDWLKEQHLYEGSLIFICGDHGQADEGWHEPYSYRSSVTPLVVVGSGVQSGQMFDYCEIIDIAPTIVHVMGKRPSALSQGRVLEELFTVVPEAPASPGYIRRLNEVLLAAHALRESEKKILADAGFLTIDAIGTWHQTPAGDDFGAFVARQEKIYKGNR